MLLILLTYLLTFVYSQEASEQVSEVIATTAISDDMIKHGGHYHTKDETEQDSLYILSIMLIVMILSQFLLIYWRKNYQQSFDRMTLLGLWLIPIIFSIYWYYYRMIFVWCIYTIITFRIILLTRAKPIAKQTPRKVYKWFFFAYKVCMYIAEIAYILVMIHMMGFLDIIFPTSWHDFISENSLMMLFYGLFYGVLTRDFAVLCTTTMAVKMGYYTSTKSSLSLPSKQLPANTCAICNDILFFNLRTKNANVDESKKNEKIITLDCGHQYHDFCIRGWTIIGKRSMCPYCSEKVNLKQLTNHSWLSQSALWSVLLDSIRYLVVYNPIILMIVQFTLYILY